MLARLLGDPDFERLSARIQTFNIFQALKLDQHEIRHSNVLAWLLDPKQTHGLGSVFLRRFLSSILLKRSGDSGPLSAARIELLDFTDIEVRREWRNLDLLIIDRRNEFVVMIENKVYSGEGIGQLKRYRELIAQEFPGFKRICVFLTLLGEEPDQVDDKEEYISWSYADVLATAGQVVDQRKSQMTVPVANFIEHYLDVLRRLTMQDAELVNLCKEIYRRHHEAIDLIVDYGRQSPFQSVVEEVLKDHKCEILLSGPSWVWFLPTEWRSLIPENCVASGWARLSRPVSVCFWLNNEDGRRVKLVFECAAMKDPQLRLSLVNNLKAAGFKLLNKAFDADATYSRFFTHHETVDDPSDPEAVKRAVAKCMQRVAEKLPAVKDVCERTFARKRA
jgi:hypothetical protein